MGGNNYKHLVPSGFYIDVNDYKSVKDLTDYLIFLNANPVSILIVNSGLGKFNSLTCIE